MAREYTCYICNKVKECESDTGRLPGVCPECKALAEPRPAKKPARKKPTSKKGGGKLQGVKGFNPTEKPEFPDPEHDNLCDTCQLEFATCPDGERKYGTGPGCDNVIGCSNYSPMPEIKEVRTLTEAEIKQGYPNAEQDPPGTAYAYPAADELPDYRPPIKVEASNGKVTMFDLQEITDRCSSGDEAYAAVWGYLFAKGLAS